MTPTRLILTAVVSTAFPARSTTADFRLTVVHGRVLDELLA